MRNEFLAHLRCPLCGGVLVDTGPALRCPQGHSFDFARQGYVNLLTGRAAAPGDSAQMVAARADLLAAGHFDFITAALTTEAGRLTAGAGDEAYQGGLIVDVGAGTGHYLAAVLEALPGFVGLALDVAKPAVRRAARAHPRAAAAVCDVWRGLPLADASADLILDVFAPRNGAEFRRVLRGTGALLVVIPGPDHLGELIGPLRLLSVDPDKEHRLSGALDRWFRPEIEREYAETLALPHPDVARLVAMGPSAHHVDPAELARRIATLPEPVPVTASVRLCAFRCR